MQLYQGEKKKHERKYKSSTFVEGIRNKATVEIWGDVRMEHVYDSTN